jgi:hypothetical protein
MRAHEEELANFFTGLGLPRRASKELADTLCEFGEVCEALKELADTANARERKDVEQASCSDHQ